MPESIKDRVAVVGVGCTKFGEHPDRSVADLLVDAVYDAYADAGIDPAQIQAAWLGTYLPTTGVAGLTLADALRLYNVPITHVENYCVTGMDAFRNACFAVAAGIYDVVLAAGVEKLKDMGARGIPEVGAHQILARGRSAPGAFALSATRYMHQYDVGPEALAMVAVKNHANGADHPKAQLRRPITVEQALAAPMVASPLRLYDCCPTSDGAAAVIITRPELAKNFRDDPVYVKAISLSVNTGRPFYQNGFDYTHWEPTVAAARGAYAEAGITDPNTEIDLVECHDCFTITEILNIEDLGLAKKGRGWRYVAEGRANVDGEVPVNPSGGLKAFGHPIGATGLRMVYEVSRQLQGRADGRQVKDPERGLAHNLGGPGGTVACVSILGRDLG
jgi:acetyl-CoA C-acetyltransferase